jgi:hypothetical protein
MEYKLDGPKLIKRIIRPPRVAFIVSAIEDIHKFISIASLSWGGRHLLAVPYLETEDISEEWYDVIKKI